MNPNWFPLQTTHSTVHRNVLFKWKTHHDTFLFKALIWLLIAFWMTSKIFNRIYKALGLGLIPAPMETIPLPLPLISVLQTKWSLITEDCAVLSPCSLQCWSIAQPLIGVKATKEKKKYQDTWGLLALKEGLENKGQHYCRHISSFFAYFQGQTYLFLLVVVLNEHCSVINSNVKYHLSQGVKPTQLWYYYLA